MIDSDKTKEQILNELIDLREKIVELEDVKNSLKKLEEKKEQLEDKYRSLFENAPVYLATFNLKGVITSCNKAWLKISGYTREEIVGKHFSKLKFISIKNLPEYFKMFKSLLSGKDIKPFTENYFLKDGSMLYLRVHLGRIKEKGRTVGYNVMTIDITERQEVFQKLKESEDKYRNFFENMPGVYYRTDREGNLLMINPAGAKLFGYENTEEMIGKNVAQNFYFNPEERKVYLDKLKKYKGTLKETELIFKKKNGDPIIVSGTSHFYCNKEGNITGTEGNFIDITERKKNEQIQKVLYNISKAANSSISLDQLYPVIHKELGTIIDTTNFYIALLDQGKNKISFPYHVDEMDDDFETQSIKDKSLTCYVINHKNSLLLNYDTIQKLHKQGELLNPGAVTKDIFWFGVPLKVEDKIIGAMAVQSYNNPNLYSEKDTTLLEFVSSQVATAIERKQTEDKVKHLSFHDFLTNIYNRAYFMEELERLNFPRYYPLSIVSIDINGLKFINDTFGHSEGDKLLKHFAVILKSVSRKGDILARVGGDEFAIILPFTSFLHTHDFCERVKKACKDDNIEPTYLAPSISLGYATQDGNYRDIDSFLKESDNRMYQDKLFTAKNREKHLLDSILIILAERDPHTRNHAQRLQNLALSLGRKIRLSDFQLNNLKLLALLHDIGKIGIPDSILFKTYILTPSEWKKMKEHSNIGYRIARNFPDFSPIAREILYHHEKWDGSGYPEGLKGENIPLLSRVISIVDAYDVMQSRRPYKGAISKKEALKELNRCAGSQFDPNLVKIFVRSEKSGNLNMNKESINPNI